MALDDYHFQWRGLTMGPGLPVRVEYVEGLDDLVARIGDMDLPRNHGAISGLHTVAAREVILGLTIVGEKRSQELADSVAEVLSLFRVTDDTYTLSFKEPGMAERFIYARLIGRQRPRNPSTTHGREQVVVRLRAADPRLYGAESKSATLGVYSASGGGMDYPGDYGLEFPVDSSSEVVVVNDGDARAYPRLRFYGPTVGTVTGVSVTNTTTGVVFESVSDILTGQVLEADMRRIITADTGDTPYINLDGSSRWGDWQTPRTPLYLDPGYNALRFEVTGTSTDATCVANFRDTWL